MHTASLAAAAAAASLAPQAAEQAATNFACVSNAAHVLCPPLDAQAQAAAAAAGQPAGGANANGGGPPQPLLFNPQALQLWILRWMGARVLGACVVRAQPLYDHCTRRPCRSQPRMLLSAPPPATSPIMSTSAGCAGHPLHRPSVLSRTRPVWRRCCQPSKGGGLRDKPGKPVDYYHTCYCLSGLAAAQHLPGARVLGPRENLLRRADPACNVEEGRLRAALRYYERRPVAAPGVGAGAAAGAGSGGGGVVVEEGTAGGLSGAGPMEQ